MVLLTKQTYTKNEVTTWPVPNYWDMVALVLVFGGLILIAWNIKQMTAPYRLGEIIPISLNPINLPAYALRTILRLFIALFFSLIFTFVFGSLAAKNKHAERLIIPIIDVLQSAPVLSFLTITIPAFFYIFKNSMLGPECAAIFGIFTGQVWNMTLAFYQGIKTVHGDIKEVADVFRLSVWQRFWRVEVPFSMPGLLWNMMMSMSGSWFFVVACEALTVADQNITLPGIGSYIALASTQANGKAIVYAILCMLVVIFLYDQLLFRPLIYWTETFKESQEDDVKAPRSWLISLFQHTKLLSLTSTWFSRIGDAFINFNFLSIKARKKTVISKRTSWIFIGLYYLVIFIVVVDSLILIGRFIVANVTFVESRQIMILGFFTGIRVMVLIFLSSLVWVPIGVWIGLKPRVTSIIQPIIQFFAAFPMNLLFPVIVMLMLRFKLNIEIWSAPLMVLGTQWYILFNVIAGTSVLPKELKLVAANFKVTGLLWWRRVILPGIAPYIITGAITAAGGAWNASIVAEAVSWGTIKLRATGLGSYIQWYSAHGDFPRVICGTIAMCIIVLLVNRLFWRPLYHLALNRYQTESTET